MKIGELAQKTGCPVTRIRFYEQKGLLPAPSRSPGGQRNYTEKAAERLEFISTCRANGMKLECIERFIAYEKDPSLGSQWLLDRIDDYLAQAKIQREKLDKAESTCSTSGQRFRKKFSQKRKIRRGACKRRIRLNESTPGFGLSPISPLLFCLSRNAPA